MAMVTIAAAMATIAARPWTGEGNNKQPTIFPVAHPPQQIPPYTGTGVEKTLNIMLREKWLRERTTGGFRKRVPKQQKKKSVTDPLTGVNKIRRR